MDRASVPPFRHGVVEVSSCGAPTVCTRSAALSQFAPLAERLDTMSSAVQNVVASAGFSVASSGVPAQAPLLSATVATMGAPFRSLIPLPKRARRRASLKQLAGPSRQNSLIHHWERSATWPESAARRCPLSPCGSLSGSSTSNPPTGPIWGCGVVAQGH